MNRQDIERKSGLIGMVAMGLLALCWFLIAFVALGFAAPSMVVGEVLVWEESTGADSYKITWYPVTDPTGVSMAEGIYNTRYAFAVGDFAANIAYTIEVRGVDCCGAESAPAVIRYYKKVGSGGDCCHESVVKDKDSECWVGVEGLSWFRPGGLINEGCSD